MDPIVSTNTVPTGQAQTVRQREEGEADGTAISSDFETFLRLLTTQLKNQDPSKPMESSEFAVQLATFSSVEQQVQSNDLLKSLVAQSDAAGLSELAGWVGMDARSSAPRSFDGTSLELVPPRDPTAGRTELVVLDESGSEVGRQSLANDGAPLIWLGTGNEGAPLPPGRYSFNVEGFAGETLVSTQPIEQYARIVEVQQSSAGPVLVMTDGTKVAANEVSAVRAHIDG